MTSIGSNIGLSGVFSSPIINKIKQADQKSPSDQGIEAVIAKKTAADEFLEYARKTPAEKMEDMILKELGITKEELNAMSPEQRAGLQEKIAARMKEKMQEEMQKQSGMPVKGNLVSMLV